MSTNLLTTEQAAACLGISEITLAKWRRAGKGPAATRLGHHTVRYTKPSIDGFVAALSRAPVAKQSALLNAAGGAA
jgi:predicted DNA-binding transcriptional regulator AlpA